MESFWRNTGSFLRKVKADGKERKGKRASQSQCPEEVAEGEEESEDGLRREAAWRNVGTPEGIQVPSESLGLSIVGHSMM